MLVGANDQLGAGGFFFGAHTGGACTNGVETKEEHLETDRRGACAATRTERDGFTGKSLRSACAEESLEKIRSATEGIASATSAGAAGSTVYCSTFGSGGKISKRHEHLDEFGDHASAGSTGSTSRHGEQTRVRFGEHGERPEPPPHSLVGAFGQD